MRAIETTSVSTAHQSSFFNFSENFGRQFPEKDAETRRKH
jgi:hypothetical protein